MDQGYKIRTRYIRYEYNTKDKYRFGYEIQEHWYEYKYVVYPISIALGLDGLEYK